MPGELSKTDTVDVDAASHAHCCTCSQKPAKRRRNISRIAVLLTALAAIIGLIAACDSSGGGQAADSKTQKSTYDYIVGKQPALKMTYSPTRDTINFWIKTWNVKGKLAYIYLMNSNGDFTGYFVFVGPPVSMCTALTPTFQVKTKGDSGQAVVPAPGMDAAWYSGGECNTYYGKDAQTGAYVEFTIGQSTNMLLYDQPLTGHPNVPKLAPKKA